MMDAGEIVGRVVVAEVRRLRGLRAFAQVRRARVRSALAIGIYPAAQDRNAPLGRGITTSSKMKLKMFELCRFLTAERPYTASISPFESVPNTPARQYPPPLTSAAPTQICVLWTVFW